MTVPMTIAAFDLWSRACVHALGDARAEIDALNVFPVPDSDTGTNVYLTFESAGSAIAPMIDDGSSLVACVKAYVDAALVGAKGNSGVIMAQLLRAMFRSLLRSSGELAPSDVSQALTRASAAAYDAVGRPVEGTILTVAAEAARAATEAVERGSDVETVLAAACEAARVALAHTPEQMERLARAGVVDAGGRALVVVLDTTEHVLTGRWNFSESAPIGTHHIAVPVLEDIDEGGPAYEVMFLLDADDAAIPVLRERLDPLGDSLVVVGGDRLWNVHVHVDDVGAAIEAGIDAGRPRRIAVTHLRAGPPHSERQVGDASGTSTRAVISAAAGPGLARLFAGAGSQVVESAVGEGLPVARMLEVVVASHADEVILLPNSGEFISVCEAVAQQARDQGIRIAVVPTRTQVQGLAALAVHEPGRDFGDDVIAMANASGQTHHGAITLATEHGITMAGPCAPGDVLGVVDAEFAVVGKELATVAFEVIQMLMSGSAELVTIVSGEGSSPELVATLESTIRSSRPDVDVVVYDGGQHRYPLLLAVE